jgi:hypothetical protein
MVPSSKVTSFSGISGFSSWGGVTGLWYSFDATGEMSGMTCFFMLWSSKSASSVGKGSGYTSVANLDFGAGAFDSSELPIYLFEPQLDRWENIELRTGLGVSRLRLIPAESGSSSVWRPRSTEFRGTLIHLEAWIPNGDFFGGNLVFFGVVLELRFF